MRLTWRRDAAQLPGSAAERAARALEAIGREYSGRSLDEVRAALASRWAGASDDPRLVEPDLTRVAVLISGGKTFHLESDGQVVIEG